MSSSTFAAAGGPHSLGLHEARKLAFRWAEVAQEKLKMRKG